jgi:hypothetical protein
MKKKRPPLTGSDWSKVFDIRCRSKSGRPATQEEINLCARAIKDDPVRYRAMNDRVFWATSPNPMKGPEPK